MGVHDNYRRKNVPTGGTVARGKQMKTNYGKVIGVIMGISMGMMSSAFSRAGAPGCDVRISDNGHYLVYRDGTPFFPVADTAWALAWRLDREAVNRYLEHREKQQFNTIALVAFPSYDEKRRCPNAYGDYPFAIVNGQWNPLEPVTTPGNDPDRPDQYDYWDHLEYIIDAAATREMHIVLLPAWGGYVAGDWGDGHPTPEIIFDQSRAYQYGRWIGNRFRDKTNIIWMMGGDRSAVYGSRDYRPVFRAMAEGVTDGVAGGETRLDGKADYAVTLMSYHPRKWKPNSSEWFHHDPWLDFNSIQDQPSDQVRAILHDFALEPPKPTWLFEGGYEFRRNGNYTDWQVRFQSYQTVFAGGFGVTYGSMNVFDFGEGLQNAPEPGAEKSSSTTQPWERALDETGACQMGHLVSLMQTLTPDQFLERIPAQDILDGDTGTMTGPEGIHSTCIQATRGIKGDYAFVYTAAGNSIRVNMNRLAAPKMDAYWFNPRNGKWYLPGREDTQPVPFLQGITSGDGAPVHLFTPPGKPGPGNDWVLVLRCSRK